MLPKHEYCIKEENCSAPTDKPIKFNVSPAPMSFP
jgi:hypothetical protein